MKIKVSIVEDHAGTRVNMMKVLQAAPELHCLHGYPDGETALREIPARAMEKCSASRACVSFLMLLIAAKSVTPW